MTEALQSFIQAKQLLCLDLDEARGGIVIWQLKIVEVNVTGVIAKMLICLYVA